MAPNGNGGVWSALQGTGAIADMDKRKLKWIASFAVDNVLIKPADPVFIGFCEETKTDIGCKVVTKSSPSEKGNYFRSRQL